MLKFAAFKEQLHALLDNVLDGAEMLQTTAENPVVLDRAWILNKMKDQMLQEEYILEPGAMQITLGLGHLHKLPRELRDLVFGHVIADGNMAILRASKQTSKEVSKLIFQNGIYRLGLGFGNQVINPPLSPSLAKNIQSLKVRVNSRSFFIDGLDEHLPILHMFGGSTIRRKNCIVTIVCCPYHCNMDASQVVPSLKDLTGFEQVILELDLEWWGEPWPDTLYEDQKNQIWGCISGTLNRHNEILEPTLGTGHFSDDEEGLRLDFHPRK